MKRLLMITSAIGLCLAAPAFAQTSTDQEQLNKQRAAPPSSSAPAAQSQDRQRSGQQPNQGGQAQSQQPNQGNQAQQQQPATGSSSSSAQAPSNQNQSGQAQNQQQPGASSSSPSSAQAPAANQNQSGQAQNQRQPADNKTNAQAPAGQQQQERTATDRNQPAQSGQAQNRQMQQNQRQGQRQDTQTSRDRSSASLNVNINDQQRTRIAAVIGSANVRPVNVNFRIATGVVVPRTVALRTLPAGIVEIVPQYRGYGYFVTNEQIVIVEPRRKTVVAVLPAGGNARAQAPAAGNRASFSEEQRDIIRKRASTLRSTATSGSSASRIVVEEEVPATVELQEFPAEIVTEVPTVRTYRYFRQDNDVVVVDPGQRRVIEVIR